MRTKKIGLLALSLVLVLGLVGAAFASWTDTVIVKEVVNTGSVCVGIRNVSTNDAGDHGQPGDPGSYLEGSMDPGWDATKEAYTTYKKNVASCDSVNNGNYKCMHGEDRFYASVTETIDNAYPSYAPSMTIEVANCGSIPVIATGFDEVVTGPNPGLNAFTELKYWKIQKNGTYVASGSGETELGQAVVGMQVDPCDVITIIITKHILQTSAAGAECPQGASVTFTETITFTQWNKA